VIVVSVCVASSEVFDPCRTGSFARAKPPPTSTRFSYRRIDLHQSPGLRAASLAFGGHRFPSLPTWTTHSPVERRHRGVVARSPASRRRMSATARSAPKQSADPGTTDRSMSRPARSAIPDRPDASLEVSHVPFSARRSRRALAPKAAGLQTCPAPAFMPAFRPRCSVGPRSAGIRPCGFSLFFGAIGAASLKPADVRGGSFDRR